MHFMRRNGVARRTFPTIFPADTFRTFAMSDFLPGLICLRTFHRSARRFVLDTSNLVMFCFRTSDVTLDTQDLSAMQINYHFEHNRWAQKKISRDPGNLRNTEILCPMFLAFHSSPVAPRVAY
ncbi:hypothetical protein Naga_100094g13 [Nannochloropsis gaditana]|uniref:Uncharacterized protein n=1 Tax=Nannochloropsis gaditana TaxID=72520 RepID=W7TWH7_9STRA|nr:hypothetical protein Naga_100094g13 [Nannochloropsis gaditana]